MATEKEVKPKAVNPQHELAAKAQQALADLAGTPITCEQDIKACVAIVVNERRTTSSIRDDVRKLRDVITNQAIAMHS